MTDLSFITNVITTLFCAAVLVQTVRLSRAVHKLRHAGLIEVVASLEAATETSQQALGELTKVLSAEGPPLDAAVRSARDLRAQLVTLRDELSLMIDIGNGVAERILAAANGARGAPNNTDSSASDLAVGNDPALRRSPALAPEPHDGGQDPGTTLVGPSSATAASSHRSEKSGRGGRGRALAVVSTTGAPTATGERDHLPDDELDCADRPLSAAAKEPQS